MVSSTKRHYGRKSPLKRKLHSLATITRSQHVRKIPTAVEPDDQASFSKLKLKLKEIERQCVKLMNLLMNIPKEVKVEEIEAGIHVKIRCEKGGDHKLVSILEAFEKMGLEVVEAKVSSCDFWFAMEAIVVASAQGFDVRVVAPTIVDAIDMYE